MEQLDGTEMLDLMVSPVFCVKDGRIAKLNEAASRLFLREGVGAVAFLPSSASRAAALRQRVLWESPDVPEETV